MDTAAKVGFSLSFALFIVIVILVIFMTWSYYSVFQKDSYFFDLVGPSVCDPPCQHGSKCVPGFGCICSPGYYGSDCNYEVNTCLEEGKCECNEFGQGPNCFEDVYYSAPLSAGTADVPMTSITCKNGNIVNSDIFKKGHDDGFNYISSFQMMCHDGNFNYILSDRDSFDPDKTYMTDANIQTKVCKDGNPFIGFQAQALSDNGRLIDLNMVCPEDLPLPYNNPSNTTMIDEYDLLCPENTVVSRISYGHSTSNEPKHLARFAIWCSPPKKHPFPNI